MILFGLGKREQVNTNLFYMVGGLNIANAVLSLVSIFLTIIAFNRLETVLYSHTNYMTMGRH